MAEASSSYASLLGGSDLDVAEYTDKKHLRRFRAIERWQYALLASFGLSLGLNLGFAFAFFKAPGQQLQHVSLIPQRLYSPAQDAVSYKLTKFESGIYGGETPYQGPPSDGNNRLWQELYAHETSHISEEEARLLPNRTAAELPYPGSGYLIVLNVFHNLHCLDSIRQGLYYFLDQKWNMTYNPYTITNGNPEAGLEDFGGRDTSIMHLDHCIDGLRQSTLCTSDITPNVFQWSDKRNAVAARATVVHGCRDFEAIKQWAKEHRAAPFKGFSDAEELGKCGAEDPWTCLY